MKAFLGNAAALALLAALGGCVSLGGGKPPPVLLTLTAAKQSAAGTTQKGLGSDAVMVMEPETDKRLAAQRVPVQVDAAQVAYLKDAVWVERPARLFRDLMAEVLRARGGRLVLEDDQPAGAVGLKLAGRLIDMGYDARSGRVLVRFEALRTSAKGEITTHRFEAGEPVSSTKPEVIGPALNRAANDVAGQVADWLGA